MTQPYKVEASQIKRLNDVQISNLLNVLLIAEAIKFNIPLNTVRVASNIRTPDGGEDGRIEWSGLPERTEFIPNHLTQFQNKATEMTSTEFANELIASNGELKHMVASVLSQGGSYIVFTTQEINGQNQAPRINAMRNKLRNLSLPYAETADLRIYDAAMIANWTNRYLVAITSVLSWLGQPIERGLKTFESWSKNSEFHDYAFVEIPSRTEQMQQLKASLIKPGFCARIKGLSGLGKTRTAFEIFNQEPSLRDQVVYFDAANSNNISALVSDFVNSGIMGIIVVDNCDNHLHTQIQKEIERTDSELSFLSLDYNLETVSSTLEITLTAFEDAEIKQILEPVYGGKLGDLDRIIRFADGFPQMAVLLAEARLNATKDYGSLTDDLLAEKLLWGMNSHNAKDESILKGCALFDRFGFDGELSKEYEYIAGRIPDISFNDFHSCIVRFTDRGLIDRRGRYAQLVPKPLAIRLASQWWRLNTPQVQMELINSIPEDMIRSFCDQIEKLDFLPQVQTLTEQLCGKTGPFGQAGVILSKRGSRLFRSFVVVNPEATSHALFEILKDLTEDQIRNIDGDVRRNLVWSLELLCFRKGNFFESAWSLLLLASAENESWSNNSTGVFAQLFKIYLSSTEAYPALRLAVLKEGFKQKNPNMDKVILKSISGVFDTHGGTRMVGAEYQGSKPPLIEWRPKVWQEVFDYWEECIQILFEYSDYPEAIGEQSRDILGKSIRSIFPRGQVALVEKIITFIVERHGAYWPKALNSLNSIREFDLEGMPAEGLAALERLTALLTPNSEDLESLLKFYIVGPHSSYKRNEAGNYVDESEIRAEEFIKSLKGQYSTLKQYICLLQSDRPRYASLLGFNLMDGSNDANQFLRFAITQLLQTPRANPDLVLGMLRKLLDINPLKWQKYLKLFYRSKLLNQYFPAVLRSGDITSNNLALLFRLIEKGKLQERAASNIIFSTDYPNITCQEIGDFAIKLAAYSPQGAWTAFDLLSMHTHSSEPRKACLKNEVKKIATQVELHGEGKTESRDWYSWTEIVLRLIETEPPEFSLDIAKQIIAATKHNMDHTNIWDYIKKIVAKLLDTHLNVIWSLFSVEIINANYMDRYWLRQIFEREDSFSIKNESLFNKIPIESILAWCHEYPDIAPAFVAESMNVFKVSDSQKVPTELFVRLLEEFGDSDDVASSLRANLSSKGWSGSLVPHLQSDMEALSLLQNHANAKVQAWIRNQISYLKKSIAYENERDEEDRFR